MMLTFPALNGISMLMTSPGELEEVAGTMLFLPVLNGVMCAIFLALFNRFVHTYSALRGHRLVLCSGLQLAPSGYWLCYC